MDVSDPEAHFCVADKNSKAGPSENLVAALMFYSSHIVSFAAFCISCSCDLCNVISLYLCIASHNCNKTKFCKLWSRI